MSTSSEEAEGDAGLAPERAQLLLQGLDRRLDQGEVLIAEGHFLKALTDEYRQQEGEGAADPADLAELAHAAVSDPQRFAAVGLENWLARTFLAQVRQEGWDVGRVQEEGSQGLRDLVKQDKVRAVLDQCGVLPARLNLRRSLSRVAAAVAGREASPGRRRPRAVPTELAESGKKVYRLEAVSEPSEAEAEGRRREQAALGEALRTEQLDALVRHIESYVSQGKVTPEEAEKLQRLHKVEAARKQGRINGEQADKVRNSLVEGKARFALEKKVHQAADSVALYLQLFEALRRIEPRYDEALAFIVRHKEVVNADAVERSQMGGLIKELLEDNDGLKALLGLLDREDGEVRLMAVNLPPYGTFSKAGGDRLANMVVEEGFVEQLRRLSRDQVATSLHSADAKTRLRPAANMRCLHSLLLRLLRPTPIRKELRFLKINLIIEEFYRETDDMASARTKAQDFIQTRLQRLYPDLSPEESQEIEARSGELIEAVERRIRAERAQAEEEAGTRLAGEEELSEDERNKGVFLGRVAVRVAGRTRLMPYKIMPDEEGEGYVLARRDPQSGETVALLRQGAKRHVTQQSDGNWALG